MESFIRKFSFYRNKSSGVTFFISLSPSFIISIHECEIHKSTHASSHFSNYVFNLNINVESQPNYFSILFYSILLSWMTTKFRTRSCRFVWCYKFWIQIDFCMESNGGVWCIHWCIMYGVNGSFSCKRSVTLCV